jgi:hypothetical protein
MQRCDGGDAEHPGGDPAEHIGILEVCVQDVGPRICQVASDEGECAGICEPARADPPRVQTGIAQPGFGLALGEQVSDRQLELVPLGSFGEVGQQELRAAPGQRVD